MAKVFPVTGVIVVVIETVVVVMVFEVVAVTTEVVVVGAGTVVEAAVVDTVGAVELVEIELVAVVELIIVVVLEAGPMLCVTYEMMFWKKLAMLLKMSKEKAYLPDDDGFTAVLMLTKQIIANKSKSFGRTDILTSNSFEPEKVLILVTCVRLCT